MKCPKCHFENPDDTVYCGKCAEPLRPSEEISAPPTETLETPKEELTTGSAFAGRYQIIEELGKGGMGKVYKVMDKKIKEKVALKLLRPEISSDKKTIERFSNELKFARKIRHENVCQMYDLNEEKGTHYITMEYVHGEDMKRLIRKMGQLSAGQAISIAKQVCEGLAEAHRLGVVHRDLKPQNIMVDEEGNARIMDFGIARSIKAKGITGAGVMIGTPEYMSPEQVEGKEVDQRSDIYSMGVILYEMVTGRVPFEGDTPFTIGMKHKSEMPRDPKELNTHIPEDLSLVILRCMEKDKEKRYQSAGELRSELTNIEKGIPPAEKVVPERKPITSKEITVTFGLKRLFIPALVVIALVILAVAIWLIWQASPQRRAVPAPSGIPSIAVLPFTDLSAQKDQEHFCDGMTETIIAKLSSIEELKVISRTSVMRYKGTDKDIKDVGQELGVATILEGSIQKEKDNIRLIAQLVNVKDGFHIWSDTYDRKLVNVFEIQSDVAENIAKALKAKLSPEEKERLVKKPTENLEAYNLYLKGRYYWNKRTEEGLKTGVDHFEQAIKEDPDYALAYAGLADCYVILPWYSPFPLKEAYPKAKEATLKALEIDDTLAEAHASLAFVKLFYDWDWAGAESEFKRAIGLNPGYATAHHWYAFYFVFKARFDEAIKEMKQARELDPLSLIINVDLGQMFYLSRRYDQAIEVLQKTLKMDPNFRSVHQYFGLVYLEKSMYKEALAELQKEKELLRSWDPDLETAIGVTYMKMGKREEAQQVLEDMMERSRQGHIIPYFLAALYFALGENDQGFEWLQKAYDERDKELYFLKVNPLFDSVRSDPRFKALLKKIGLE